MEKKHLLWIVLVLGGVIFADKIRALPVVGPHIPTF